MSTKISLSKLLNMLDLRISSWLLFLMVAAALTEGVGLILLVPMLAELSGGHGGRIYNWLAKAGLPTSLSALLTIFALLVIARAVINQQRTMASVRLQNQVVDDLRARTWEAMLNCSWRTFSTMRVSDIAGTLSSNIEMVGLAVSHMLTFMALTITLGGLGLAALAISPMFAVFGAIGGILILTAYRNMRKRAHLLGTTASAAYLKVHGRIDESLRAMRLIKSLGLERRVAQDGVAAVDSLRSAQYAYLNDLGRGIIILQGAGAILLALGVWLSMTKAGASAYEILPLVALFARGLPMLSALQEAWQNWAHHGSAVFQTFELIERAKDGGEPPPGAVDCPDLKHKLELSGVSVHWSANPDPTLKSINLALEAGSTTALIGASGAGKSTLADLFAGLLEPDEGSITIDGVRLDTELCRAWRSRVAYIQQDPVIFSESIRDNLARANPAADEARMRRALADASALFVDGLPQGIDTVIGDGGRRLSGGEQQRIALARALLRDPKLLILDESTSALDSDSEASVVEAIRALQGKLTILIIAHRGALVSLADRVVEIADGRIISETQMK